MSKPWQDNLKEYARRPLHWYRAQRIDLERISTAVMAVGPNRNMTTFTASLIALHPQVQVLNNAGKRQIDKAEALFSRPAPDTFRSYLRSALWMSQGGKRGPYGGTITISHAFDRPAMREAYQRRFGDSVLKDDVRCVYWKAAVFLTAWVRERSLDLGAVAAADPRVRFLMPIRNPLHCAMSNYRLGHYTHFRHLQGAPVEQVVDFIVELVGWFMDFRVRQPQSFFCWHEQDFGRPMLEELAAFLGVDADEGWLADCLRSSPRGKDYELEPALVESYHASLQRHLARHPTTRDKLAELAPVPTAEDPA